MLRQKGCGRSEEEDQGDLVIKEESLSNDGWDDAASGAAACSTSAFLPYRAVTVLTNLQRGNVQTLESVLVPEQMNWHTRAAMGEITAQDLMQAAQSGCEQERLGYQDSAGLTALCWSASYGQLPTVRLLLQHGADIEHEGEDGHTPLQLACSSGHHEVVKLLLSAGANPDRADHMGCTPLMFAAAGDHPHCVAELLEHHSSFTATTVTGTTAHAIAVRRGSTRAQAVLERYLLRLLESS